MIKEAAEAKLGYSSFRTFEDTTFEEEATFWLEQMKVELSSGWHKRSTEMLRQMIIPRYGHLSPNKFTIPFMRRIQSELKATTLRNGLGHKHLANSTVNRYTENISAVLNYSAKTQRIPLNPARGYTRLPDDRVELSYWQPDEVKDFLGFVSRKYPKGHEERWVYVVFLVALNCGLRAGELWGLMPEDIKEETLYIKRQWKEIDKRFDLLKGKRGRKARDRSPYRHTVLHSQVRQELRDLVEQREVAPNQTIFYGEGGRPRGHNSFVDRFKRLKAEWGGRDIRFHDLRHTAITLWVHAGISLNVVQQMAGHENIMTTMNYVHMIGGSVNQFSRMHLIAESSEPILLEAKSTNYEK
jgi:integrase